MTPLESPPEPPPRTSAIAIIWKIAQPVLLVATLAFVANALYEQWPEVEAKARDTTFRWNWILLSSVVVLLTYAMLVESWRRLIQASGATLHYGPAVLIWTTANLGRYIPGKVWSIGALGLLAQRYGVPGFVAAGAAIVGTLLNIGAGFGITALTAWGSLGLLPDYVRYAAIIGGVGYVVGLALLPWVLPPLVARIAKWRRIAAPASVPPIATIWIVALLNSVAWILYGVAFAMFARGATPAVMGTPLLFIAVYTASYLAGYLILFAPGGLGIREGILAALVTALGMATSPDAYLLALFSRLWLTVLEIVPGLIGLGLLSFRARQA